MAKTTTNEESELLIECKGGVAVLRLNRPAVLNALSDSLMDRLTSELQRLDQDPAVKAFLITGGERVFAAGADIKGMAEADVSRMAGPDLMAKWERLRRVRKPLVAAVGGYALGGGFELVMSCDIIVAAEDAVFGQPEILLGVIPGAGGTQRLTRAIGKYRAMEYILTGRRFSAREAHAWGLVNRVVPRELLLEEALRLATEIAERAPLAACLAKEAVNRALDVDLESGLLLERRLFYLLFGTQDQKEGMRAFLEKRKPQFEGR